MLEIIGVWDRSRKRDIEIKLTVSTTSSSVATSTTTVKLGLLYCDQRKVAVPKSLEFSTYIFALEDSFSLRVV